MLLPVDTFWMQDKNYPSTLIILDGEEVADISAIIPAKKIIGQTSSALFV